MSLPTAGSLVRIDGQHDVKVDAVAVTGWPDATPIVVSNSTRISLTAPTVTVNGNTPGTTPGIAFNGVTDSLVEGASVTAPATAAIVLDAATAGVTVRSSTFQAHAANSSGVDVVGQHNSIIDNRVLASRVDGIRLEPGAADNIVAGNLIQYTNGRGIRNVDADRTAITNNSILQNCGAGIAVEGSSSGVSVQNNIVLDNGLSRAGCDPILSDGIDIGVYSGAVGVTVVDYNDTSDHGLPANGYAWGTPMDLAGFRAVSGQGAHDRASPFTYAAEDSANSAAPGWQSLDRRGKQREDDPTLTNSGAGPVPYADRGADETLGVPTVRAAVTAFPTVRGNEVIVDASRSSTWTPVALATYHFDFGDGLTVDQSTPVTTHIYGQAGKFVVTVTVVDANGAVGSGQAVWTYALRLGGYLGSGRTVRTPVRPA